MKLYGYWRSSAAYRVRLALRLKGIEYEDVAVNLAPGKAEHRDDAYRALNPAGLVPALAIDGHLLTQSLAICEYLEETRPGSALLPEDAAQRAFVRALAQDVACDIHPVNNLRIQQFLKSDYAADGDGVLRYVSAPHDFRALDRESKILQLLEAG